ncbi:LCP family protein [Tissierellaceae bacterium HCP3S3_D8]
MKTFLKVFIVSFLCFFIAFYIGGRAYIKDNNIALEEDMGFGFAENLSIPNKIFTKLETSPVEVEKYSSLQEAYDKSSRKNFLILGMEDIRTDAIILASLCPNTKKVDVISIPRDTYIHRKGYNTGEQRKINSIYYVHGIEGVKKTVSHILEDIPIHHYIMVEYEGVEKIVDMIGGVEVDVPFHMKYRDPTATPPLNIDIPAGKQVLSGKDSLNFIRYRKGNNRMGYVDGDLGRIKTQHEFLKSFVSKSLDNILSVVTKGFSYVKTDVGMLDALSYGRKVMGMEANDINYIILPGKSDLRKINRRVFSYFIHNDREIKKVLEEMYNVESTE